MAALLVHGLALALLLWRGTVWLTSGIGPGPAGGGGGGGSAEHFLAIPAFAAPAPAAKTQAAVTPPVATPEPAPVIPPPVAETQPVTPPPVVASGTSEGTNGGPGSGTGSDGGQGGGVGGGVGNDSGPGSGGSGAYIGKPDPRAVLLPADCARGRFVVHFWVTAEGQVAKVTVDPQPKSATCRRDMHDKMMGYLFYPARTRDRRPVASEFEVTLEH